MNLSSARRAPTPYAIYYKVVMGKRAIEVMFFDPNGKVSKVIAHYN